MLEISTLRNYSADCAEFHQLFPIFVRDTHERNADILARGGQKSPLVLMVDICSVHAEFLAHERDAEILAPGKIILVHQGES